MPLCKIWWICLTHDLLWLCLKQDKHLGVYETEHCHVIVMSFSKSLPNSVFAFWTGHLKISLHCTFKSMILLNNLFLKKIFNKSVCCWKLSELSSARTFNKLKTLMIKIIVRKKTELIKNFIELWEPSLWSIIKGIASQDLLPLYW